MGSAVPCSISAGWTEDPTVQLYILCLSKNILVFLFYIAAVTDGPYSSLDCSLAHEGKDKSVERFCLQGSRNGQRPSWYAKDYYYIRNSAVRAFTLLTISWTVSVAGSSKNKAIHHEYRMWILNVSLAIIYNICDYLINVYTQGIILNNIQLCILVTDTNDDFKWSLSWHYRHIFLTLYFLPFFWFTMS